MTKTPELLDHIGWDLVRIAAAWESLFKARMVAKGHHCFAEARAQLFQHLPRKGLSQAELVTRSGLTKQAVQQHLDQLEQEGLIARVPLPGDARRRKVVFTEAGRDMLRDGNAVKQAIEAQWRNELGAARFDALRAALKELLADRQET